MGTSALAPNPVIRSLQPNQLTLVCRKCTRQQAFPGKRIAQAVEAAKQAGWTHAESGYVCGKCPK